jgi:hypothetical protein
MLDDRNIEALLRPAKAVLEAAAGCGARLSRLAATRSARSVLVDTLDEQATLDLSARGVTYLGLDSWAQPELTDLIVESVVGRVLHTENHRGHAGSIRRVVLIEGAHAAKDETVVKLLGRARSNGVVVILSGNGPTEKEHVPGDSRNVTAEQQSRRLWNTNVRIAVGERREACTEVLETFGLTDEQRAAFSELQNGQVALLVVKPNERLIPVKVRIRKPHETLR